MIRQRLAQRPQQKKTGTGVGGRAHGSVVTDKVLELQRQVGNKAVTRILARDFHGDGKHRRTDTRYAAQLGSADAARLAAAGSLSSTDQADVNAKLAWFQAGGHDAYLKAVKPTLVQVSRPEIDMSDDPAVLTANSERRMRLERQIGDWFNVIQKIKHDRIVAWDTNAHIPEHESKLSEEALEAAVAIVSLGLGGVVYGVMEKMLEHKLASHLVKEFVLLAGLEAGDIAAEAAFHKAMTLAQKDIAVGIDSAATKKGIELTTKGALATKGNDLTAYVEALKLQTIQEEAAQHEEFNTKTAAAQTDQELIEKSAALKLTYEQLLLHPEDYLRQLTIGFIRLQDEIRDAELDKEHGGDRDRTFREDPRARGGWLKPGVLQVSAPNRFSLGKWESPDLSFPLHARAGGLNTTSLETLHNAELKDLPLTIGFSFGAKNPYSGWWVSSDVWISFTRDPSGRFFVDDYGDAYEWLASYYTRNTREHTDEERKKYAPLGARKLYDAIKGKPLSEVEHVSNITQ